MNQLFVASLKQVRSTVASVIVLLITGHLLAQNPQAETLPIKRETRQVSGWKLHIDQRLIHDQAQLTEHAVKLLREQLDYIVANVPSNAVKQLQQVPLYFSPNYPGQPPRAEFHPNAQWLRENGRDPAMAQAVEFSNITVFEKEMVRMPNFALHELAHAYHFRFLPDGFGNPQIKEAFKRAEASGQYNRVERWFGNGQPNAVERSYALTNPMEYFAESSEAYFARNDFFPFTREQLRDHDPAMFELLGKLWGTKQ